MAGQTTHYLESKVLTAPPQRLHLMLIEGALRFGKQAADAFARGDEAAASPPLLRVIDIVGELLAGVRGKETELNDRLAKFYWFVFQRVSEAKIHSNAGKLAEALNLLEYERETWQLACDKVASATPAKLPVRHAAASLAAEGSLSLEA
jgi:flagellar protein FliS